MGNALDWNDRVRTIQEETGSHTIVDRTLTELDRYDEILDLTDLGGLSTAILTLPASCEVKYVAAIVTELVVAGGTTVKLGIGPTGTKNKYGNLATLVVGAHVETVFGTVLTSTESVLLSAVASNGTSAGDTNISAGKVRVVIEYYTPNVLE